MFSKCFQNVSALVFLSSFASFIVLSCHCKFVSICSPSSSPMVYNFFSFHLFLCFLALTKGYLVFHFLFCFCSRTSSCLLRAFIIFFCVIVSSFRVLFLLHHWFINIFSFLLSVGFLVLAKVITAPLPAVWIFAMLYLLRRCCRCRCCLRV